MPLPPAANFHINRLCNYTCRFCFATFRDVPGSLSLNEALRLQELLARSGIEKLNYAGGEPTLHPHLVDMALHARSLGMTTSLVTNGARLGALLVQHGAFVDWVGLSVDSASEDTEQRLGRGRGGHVRRCLALAEQCRAVGIRLKLNTVVSRENMDESLHGLLRQMRPERWKVFQVLPIFGQNDGSVEPLLISQEEFVTFLERHADLVGEGLGPVAEDNTAMTNSYLMIDPEGRCFGNGQGIHTYSRPILEVGLETALSSVGFSSARFEDRGGRYAWGRP
jgi:radical S-adenosyl methionine domain-containing protein 2